MSRILPHPLLALALLLVWLLLNRFSLGHLILGSFVAMLATWAFASVEPKRLRVLRPGALIRLFFIVGYDIIRSNIAVATLIATSGRHGKRNSGFVRIPLRLKDPMPLAVLSMIITATPGTAWIEFDEESGNLLLHVFDLIGDADWVTLITERYETLLLEIFPC